MVVAGPHLIEQRRVHLDAQRFAGIFLDLNVDGEPSAAKLDIKQRLIGEHLVLDDIAGHFAVERHQFVVDDEPSASRR